MAEFKNIGSCPPSILRFVQTRLAETERRRDHPHWLDRVLGTTSWGLYQTTADVRWFSECSVVAKAVSGYLLARWLVTANTIVPLEFDFDYVSPDQNARELSKHLEALVVDFAFNAEENRCIVVEIDLRGRVKSAEYELSDGRQSSALGRMVGRVARKRVRRLYGDKCVPEGWRPRPA